jgi:hypothetical protein
VLLQLKVPQAEGAVSVSSASDGKASGQNLLAKCVRDVNFPDGSSVSGGQLILKEWEFLNPVGAAQWPRGTKLIFLRGDRELLEEQEEFALPELAPGQKIIVAVPLMLRSGLKGQRRAYFQVADAQRNVFGDRCWVDVVITPADAKMQPAARPKSERPVAPLAVAPIPPIPLAAAPPAVASPAVASPQVPKQGDSVQAKDGKETAKQSENQFAQLAKLYQSQLEALYAMGFASPEVNLSLLQQHSGNLQLVLSSLLDLSQSQPVY